MVSSHPRYTSTEPRCKNDAPCQRSISSANRIPELGFRMLPDEEGIPETKSLVEFFARRDTWDQRDSSDSTGREVSGHSVHIGKTEAGLSCEGDSVSIS